MYRFMKEQQYQSRDVCYIYVPDDVMETHCLTVFMALLHTIVDDDVVTLPPVQTTVVW